MNVLSVQKLLERTKSKDFAFEEDRQIIIEFCEKYLASRTLTIEVVNDDLSRVRHNDYIVGEVWSPGHFPSDNKEFNKSCPYYGARFLERAIQGQKDIVSCLSWMMTQARENNYIFPSNS
jgi:hypothetical protein